MKLFSKSPVKASNSVKFCARLSMRYCAHIQPMYDLKPHTKSNGIYAAKIYQQRLTLLQHEKQFNMNHFGITSTSLNDDLSPNSDNINCLLQAEEYISNQTPISVVAETLYRITKHYIELNNMDKMKEYCLKLININHKSFQIRQYLLLGHVYNKTNKFMEVLNCFEIASNLTITNQYELESKIIILQQLSLYYQKLTAFDKSLKYQKMLFDECQLKTTTVFKHICNGYKNIANQLYKEEKYKKCISICHELLQFVALNEDQTEWKQICDKYKLYALKTIAQIFYHQNDSDKAIIYIRKALHIDDNDYLCNYLLGRYYIMDHRNLNEALKYLMRADHSSSNSKCIENKHRANVQYLMAGIYTFQHDLQKANICIQIAIDLCNNLSYLYSSRAVIMAHLGDIFQVKKNLEIVSKLGITTEYQQEMKRHFNGILSIMSKESEYLEYQDQDANIVSECLNIVQTLNKQYSMQ